MAKQSAAAKRVAINTPPAALREIRDLGAKNAAPFERLIHERVRLAIVSALAVNESLAFVELREILGTTEQSQRPRRKLEEAGYLKCIKYSTTGRPKPNTGSPTPGARP